MLFEGYIHDFLAWLPWNREDKEKRALRALVEQKRRVMSKEDVHKGSAAIVRQIEASPRFQAAKVVMLYYPVHNEVDLRPLLEKYYHEKIMLLPVTHRHYMEVRPYDGEDMMRRGHLGVPEPQTERYRGHIDMIFVPGVAFDHHRNRIGRGGGYYDKFLRGHAGAFHVGVCYDYQLKNKTIPHSMLDRKMDRIITPSRKISH